MDGKNISSGEYIYSKLKEMIQKGQLKAGDKLPTVMELSKKYSVSRNTVRGAINRLIVLGMVESFQGKGTYVKETNFTNQIQNVLPMFLSGGSDYFSLMNLRTAIESQAAYMAAQRATYRDIKELEKIIDDLEVHREDLDYYAEKDIEVHFKIAEISGNQLFIKLISMIRDMLKDVLEDFIKDFGNYESIRAHRNILEGIKLADPEMARNAMQKHMQTVINRYLAIPKKEDTE